LAAWVTINGVKAFTLFDRGSTANAISPDFVRTAKVKVYHLENPVTLQLDTKGSCSEIIYGSTARYTLKSNRKSVLAKEYLDIANVDQYDTVVGTVFMHRHGIVLDFNEDTIKMKGSVIPTLSEGEE
ncbi:hypothetical protein L218DRAFT_816282, partial [Marasmius fiardii PR-910]